MAIDDPLENLNKNLFDKLFNDAIVRRQIALQGYSNSLTGDIIALLDETQGALEVTIRDRLVKLEQNGGVDFGPATTQRLNAIRVAIAKVRDVGFNEAK